MRKPKPGQLRARWRATKKTGGDLVYRWGEDVDLEDVFLLNAALAEGQDPTGLVFELRRRGYDLATLRFSVEKRKEAT